MVKRLKFQVLDNVARRAAAEGRLAQAEKDLAALQNANGLRAQNERLENTVKDRDDRISALTGAINALKLELWRANGQLDQNNKELTEAKTANNLAIWTMWIVLVLGALCVGWLILIVGRFRRKLKNAFENPEETYTDPEPGEQVGHGFLPQIKSEVEAVTASAPIEPASSEVGGSAFITPESAAVPLPTSQVDLSPVSEHQPSVSVSLALLPATSEFDDAARQLEEVSGASHYQFVPQALTSSSAAATADEPPPDPADVRVESGLLVLPAAASLVAETPLPERIRRTRSIARVATETVPPTDDDPSEDE